MMKMIEIIKEIKMSNNLKPVFSKMREAIFGKTKDITIDKNFKEKMELIQGLGDFIPKNKAVEYHELLRNIQ